MVSRLNLYEIEKNEIDESVKKGHKRETQRLDKNLYMYNTQELMEEKMKKNQNSEKVENPEKYIFTLF